VVELSGVSPGKKRIMIEFSALQLARRQIALVRPAGNLPPYAAGTRRISCGSGVLATYESGTAYPPEVRLRARRQWGANFQRAVLGFEYCHNPWFLGGDLSLMTAERKRDFKTLLPSRRRKLGAARRHKDRQERSVWKDRFSRILAQIASKSLFRLRKAKAPAFIFQELLWNGAFFTAI
jgi:hypothetical protein